MVGYKFDLNLQKCIDFCGDGEIWESECDDGNQLDYDGCSHTCEVERGYICKKLKNKPSVCKLINSEKEPNPILYYKTQKVLNKLVLEFNVPIKQFDKDIEDN